MNLPAPVYPNNIKSLWRKLKFKLLFAAIILVNFFFSITSHAQTSADSIKLLLTTRIEDTTRVKLLRELAQMSVETDSVRAIDFANQSIQLAKKNNFRKAIIEGYNAKASILNKLHYFEESLSGYDSAAGEAMNYGFPELASKSYYSAGIVCFMHSRYAEALNYFLKDLKISEERSDSTKMSVLYNDIGVVYENLTDYENSLVYHGKSLEIRKQLRDSSGIAMSNNNLGMVIFYQKEFLKSLNYHNESLRLRLKLNDNRGALYSRYNISNILFEVASLPAEKANEIFLFSNDLDPGKISTVLLDSAMALRQSALKEATELNDRYAMVYCMKGIGEIMATRKQWKSSLEYLEKAKKDAAELGMQKELSEIYLELHDANSALGNIKEALAYHKLYAATKDSVFNMQSARRIAGLQTQIVVDKKEQEIELLNVKAEAQEKEIKKQKLIRNMTIGGIVGFMFFTIIIYRQRNKINRERKRSDSLLLNILPAQTAEELKSTGEAKVRKHDEVTVMFTDFKNFTGLSEKMTPEELVKEINHCFSAFDSIISKYPIEKIKTIGDSYMCASGLPLANATHARDLTNAALEIRDYMKSYRKQQLEKGRDTFEIRIGLHSGAVVSGIVGTRKFAYDIWGDTVNIASRMESTCEAGKVNISGTTHQLITQHFDCEYRGKIDVKNRGSLDMFFVNNKI